ncbi:MAG: phosphodiesterase [Neomegalonema sp.]|nr:phosphodiesterase [Neomegalonema sp.]
MSSVLAPLFAAPIAHRGLHNATAGVVENSLSAVKAAAEAGYAVEIDVQMSADGEAIVIHDPTLDRTTNASGPVEAVQAAEIATIELVGTATPEAPPTLAMMLDALELIERPTPLFVEIKDRSGDYTRTDGRLEARVAQLVRGRKAPIAVMSFNPHSVALMAKAAPETPRGLLGSSFDDIRNPHRREAYANLGLYEMVRAQFASYRWSDLPQPHVAHIRAAGAPVASWTVRSAEDARQALKHSDQITFEGFSP